MELQQPFEFARARPGLTAPYSIEGLTTTGANTYGYSTE